MQNNILITGATGNVGIEVVKALGNIPKGLRVVAGVRNVTKDKLKLADYDLACVEFDFADPCTFGSALKDCDTLFLLRPPELADVGKYFRPLIAQSLAANVKHIVFLSVQGAPNNRFIPHYKIEKLIVESGISYTFLRPAYFMQNFVTTLGRDLMENKLIYLPADNTHFTLIDVRDIGAVAAQILTYPGKHENAAYDLTSDEPLSFRQMAERLSEGLQIKINYESPTLWEFFWTKKREGVSVGFILVMIMLHYLPRYQKTPPQSPWVERITGKAPFTFEQFINDYAGDLSRLETRI